MEVLRISVNEDLLAHHLPGADYADTFTVQGPETATAREWARKTLASGPKAVREAFMHTAWGALLGFTLAPADTPETMVGWQIEVDEPQLFVLSVGGRRMDGRMVFETSGTTVIWTTAVRYHSRAARPIWAGAQHLHRAIAPRILGRAAAALRSKSAAGRSH